MYMVFMRVVLLEERSIFLHGLYVRVTCLYSGLEPETVYEMRVRALTINGSGPWSFWLQARTNPRGKFVSMDEYTGF